MIVVRHAPPSGKMGPSPFSASSMPNTFIDAKRTIVKKLLALAALGLLYLLGCSDSFGEQLRDGDIIFQTSRSEQSIAIQKATRSQVQPYGNRLPTGAHIESTRQDEVQAMRAEQKLGLHKLQSMFTEVFGLGRAAALSAVVSILVVLVLGIFLFFYLAPPNTITITSGPEGSTFRRTAERYAKILQRNGVTLKILPSEGSVDNIKRLADPSSKVDIGFVQGRSEQRDKNRHARFAGKHLIPTPLCLLQERVQH